MSDARSSAARSANRDRAIAYSVFAVDVAAYASTLWIAVTSESLAAGGVASLANGLAIAFLFIVGHDCCHGSFLPTRVENRVVGQAAFLTSLHPFALWRIGHNLTHHRFTNLASRDYVYRPLSLEQYRALRPLARAAYRFHRSAIGPLTYYLAEIWLPKMIFAPRAVVRDRGRECTRDRALVGLWVASFFAAAALLPLPAWRVVVLGLLVPFATFCVVMSVAIYLHHTSPRVRWFATEAEWDRATAQRRCTVHVEVPRAISLLFHRIMDHTAHHVRPGVPIHRLHEAQGALASEAVSMRWTPSLHLEIVRTCRLYDFDRHLWLDYDGSVTADPARPPNAAATPACPAGSPGTAGAPRACSPSSRRATAPSRGRCARSSRGRRPRTRGASRGSASPRR